MHELVQKLTVSQHNADLMCEYFDTDPDNRVFSKGELIAFIICRPVINLQPRDIITENVWVIVEPATPLG